MILLTIKANVKQCGKNVQFHQQQFSNKLLVGGGWSGHAMRMCQRAPSLSVYCLELPVAVIYVKRGSGCLVGTE